MLFTKKHTYWALTKAMRESLEVIGVREEWLDG
jgi:hypothetical protein